MENKWKEIGDESNFSYLLDTPIGEFTICKKTGHISTEARYNIYHMGMHLRCVGTIAKGKEIVAEYLKRKTGELNNLIPKGLTGVYDTAMPSFKGWLENEEKKIIDSWKRHDANMHLSYGPADFTSDIINDKKPNIMTEIEKITEELSKTKISCRSQISEARITIRVKEAELEIVNYILHKLKNLNDGK